MKIGEKTVYEGIVYRDYLEKHDTTYVDDSAEGRSVYPRHLLDTLVGRRVRIVVEVITGVCSRCGKRNVAETATGERHAEALCWCQSEEPPHPIGCRCSTCLSQ